MAIKIMMEPSESSYSGRCTEVALTYIPTNKNCARVSGLCLRVTYAKFWCLGILITLSFLTSTREREYIVDIYTK